jgi:hypothetical protein
MAPMGGSPTLPTALGQDERDFVGVELTECTGRPAADDPWAQLLVGGPEVVFRRFALTTPASRA